MAMDERRRVDLAGVVAKAASDVGAGDEFLLRCPGGSYRVQHPMSAELSVGTRVEVSGRVIGSDEDSAVTIRAVLLKVMDR